LLRSGATRLARTSCLALGRVTAREQTQRDNCNGKNNELKMSHCKPLWIFQLAWLERQSSH